METLLWQKRKCQKLKGLSFILLASLRISLTRFHGYWQKTDSWIREKNILLITAKRYADISICVGSLSPNSHKCKWHMHSQLAASQKRKRNLLYKAVRVPKLCPILTLFYWAVNLLFAREREKLSLPSKLLTVRTSLKI